MNYRLMDYSLLLVVEYNPNYIKECREKFKEITDDAKDYDLKKIVKTETLKDKEAEIDKFLGYLSGHSEEKLQEMRSKQDPNLKIF